MEWQWFNWINVFFMLVNGYLAYAFFEDETEIPAYFNLVASAMNAATVAIRLI